MRIAILCLFLAHVVFGTEITTGFLLGPRYDKQAFYIRSGSGESWQKTYSGSEHRRQAQGKLMNLRLAQALYHDEWLTERPFDPNANTGAVIAALDFYKSHGVLMINVSLQGGAAGIDGKIYGLDRRNGHRYGPGKGVHVSAFRPDGSLKPEWMQRLGRLLAAADTRGMIVNVLYFYQGQDELFDSTEAIQAAARNATDWLIDHKFRNVIIDVANEWDLRGDRWDMGRYIPENILQLIQDVRDRFQKKRADYALPISVSSDGRMNYPASFTDAVDFVLLHGNGRTPAQKSQRVAGLEDVPRPVLVNEDDNGRESTPEHLSRERASCDIFFEKAAGWGYMPWVQTQRFPFRYLPDKAPEYRADLPEAERDMAYFHAVLDHIASLTLRRSPHRR
ncbi:MAG: hypothetical protein ACRD8O_17900 [Bryobacteraceae bacterium]